MQVINGIGLECSSSAVMLRSLVICKDMRKRGIASAIVEHSLKIMRQMGKKDAYLLTNTADQFTTRWGGLKLNVGKYPRSLSKIILKPMKYGVAFQELD